MTSLIIRTGSVADFDAAIAIWCRANEARRGDGEMASVYSNLRARLEGLDDWRLLVAEVGRVPIGIVMGGPARERDGAGSLITGLLHISLLAVEPSQWGQGIGRALMRRVFESGREAGYERAQLWTQLSNERAASLYESLGFTRSGRRKMDDRGELIEHFILDAL